MGMIAGLPGPPEDWQRVMLADLEAQGGAGNESPEFSWAVGPAVAPA
jgi:hypothetical protein